MMVGNVDTFFAGGRSCLERRWKVEGGWSPGGLQESSAVLNSWCGYPRNESGSGSGRGREEQDRKQGECCEHIRLGLVLNGLLYSNN